MVIKAAFQIYWAFTCGVFTSGAGNHLGFFTFWINKLLRPLSSSFFDRSCPLCSRSLRAHRGHALWSHPPWYRKLCCSLFTCTQNPTVQKPRNETGLKISQKTQKHFHPNTKNLDKLINFKVISLTLHTIVGYDVADANQACARYNKDLIGSLTSSEAKGWKRLAFSCNSSIHALRTSFLPGHQHGDADNSRKHQIRFYPTQFKPIPNSHSWLSSLPTDRCVHDAAKKRKATRRRASDVFLFVAKAVPPYLIALPVVVTTVKRRIGGDC